VGLGMRSDRESQAHLHTRRVVFELLVHKPFKLGKFNDFIIHCIYLFGSKTKKRAVKINIFAARQFGIKTNTKFNKWDQSTICLDVARGWLVDPGKDLKKRALTATVTSNYAKEFTFFNIKTNALQSM